MTEEVVKSKGKVKWFNSQKGYGFIVPEPKGTGKDVFVHYSSIQSENNYKSLKEGDMVEFVVIEAEKGPQAQEVVVVKE